LIGGEHVVAGFGESRDLMPPGVRQLGEPVRQDHHRCTTIAGFEQPQSNIPDVD
jgi:hypothetical protein